MNTKGVDSVRSPVANLVGTRRDVEQDEFIRQVANSFHHVFSTGDLSADSFRQLLQNKSANAQVVEVNQEEVLSSVDERAGKIQADMHGLKVKQSNPFVNPCLSDLLNRATDLGLGFRPNTGIYNHPGG
jgi:hypothetical protein